MPKTKPYRLVVKTLKKKDGYGFGQKGVMKFTGTPMAELAP